MKFNTDSKPLDMPKIYPVPAYNDFQRYSYKPSNASHVVGYHENTLVNHALNRCLQRNYNCGETNDIDDILHDRKNIIQSKIELILLQLSQRKGINHDVVKSINYDMCKTQTFLMGMDHENQAMDKNRLSLEQLQFDLERQLRMEQLNYFRDTGMLNRDLRDALIQYIDQVQKDSIINRLGDER